MHMSRRELIGRAVGIVGMVPVLQVVTQDQHECMHQADEGECMHAPEMHMRAWFGSFQGVKMGYLHSGNTH